MKYLLLSWFFLGMAISANCQPNAALYDSLYNKAAMDVYENPDQSVQAGAQLFEQAETTRQKVLALLLIATAYESKRQYEQSLEYAYQAKEIAEASGSVMSLLMTLNRIAAQYHQMRVNDQALQVLDELDNKIALYPYKDSLSQILGHSYALRGFIYRDKLNCNIAIDYFNNSIRHFRETPYGNAQKANVSVLLYNKGNCFLALNQPDSAVNAFKTSRKLAGEVRANSLIAFAEKGLAEVYTMQGYNAEALEALESAGMISENVGDRILDQAIFRNKALNFLALDDWQQFLEYHEKAMYTEEVIRAEERSSISTALEKDAREFDEQIERIQHKQFWALLTGSLGIVLMLYFIITSQFRFYKRRNGLKKSIDSEGSAIL